MNIRQSKKQVAGKKERLTKIIVVLATFMTTLCSTIETASAQSIAAGGTSYYYLDASGHVWAWGQNQYGQLGQGTITSQNNVPTQMPGLSDVVSIAAGAQNGLYLKNDGSVWTCGSNNGGQLGDGTNSNRSTVDAIPGLSDIVGISAGDVFFHFLKSDGTVWAVGWNLSGQLGIGNTTNQKTVVQVAGLSNITKISGGGDHTLFLKSDGTVWSCGKNNLGQLGDGTTTSKSVPAQVPGLSGIVDIAAGYTHSIFVKNNGTVLACGENTYGELGDGTTTARTTPTAMTGLTNVVSAEAGSFHEFLRKSDGSTWGAGRNVYGQLGDGTLTNRSTAVLVPMEPAAASAGIHSSLYLTSDGSIYVSGTNFNDPAGVGVSSATIPVPLPVIMRPAITPATSNICTGNTVTLSANVAGGSWSTAQTTVAAVNAGVVAGISAGIAVITYSNTNGSATATVTVGANETANAGSVLPAICQGGVTTSLGGTFGGAATAAIWSDNGAGGSFTDNSGATPGSATYMAGASAPASVTLTLNTTGSSCSATVSKTLTVNPNPVMGSVGNDGPVCPGSPLALSSSASGGTGALSYSWSGPGAFTSTQQSPTLSSFNAAGTFTVTITDANNCIAKGINTTNVMLLPSASISGVATVTEGADITLSATTPGGTWSSSASAIATVDEEDGIVYGVAPGSAVISYQLSGGCTATRTITVTSNVAASTLCKSQYIVLNPPGIPGGTWTSGNGSIATVGLTSGYAYGVNPGTVIMYYFPPSGAGTFYTTTVTVNNLMPTTGGTGMCQGQSITLTNGTGGAGTWSSANTEIAIVNAAGVVTGTGGGTVNIIYTTSAGCQTAKTIAVTALPVITGSTALCTGQSVALSAGAAGGTWSTGSAAIATVNSSGMATGVAAGTTRISYTRGGCAGSVTVAVNPLSATTSSITTACGGQQVTFANATPGTGTWTSGNTAVAVVAGGIVTGVSGGLAQISYTSSMGCIAIKPITINSTPIISGNTTVCASQTTMLSSNIAGGTWTSGSDAIASISSTGLVRGNGAGKVKIYYIQPSGCNTTATVTVNPLLPITGGTAGICASSNMTLANATPFGGVWASSNTSAATVNATTGYVKGVGAGSTTISFTATSNGCIATKVVTVNACRQANGDTDGNDNSGLSATEALADELNLYPNPNNGKFTIYGSLQNGNEEATLDVINMVGQVIYHGKAVPQNGLFNEQVQLSGNLPDGMYIMNIRTADGSKTFRFAIKN